MATKKIGVSIATILTIAGIVWGVFVFYDRKAEAGLPARVNRLEQDVSDHGKRIGNLETSRASSDTKFDFIIKRMDDQDRKLDKISDAVGAKK
jgi:hypothetical protein